MSRRVFAIVALATMVALGVGDLPPANALSTACVGLRCQVSGDGMRFDRREVRQSKQSAREVGAKKAADAYLAKLRRPARESTLTPGCPGNDPNRGSGSYDMACPYMTSYCASRGQRNGWLVWVWSRALRPDRTPNGPWARSGYSCSVPRDVLAAVRPGVTAAMIQRAFARLDFARPKPGIQPTGNITLVNLPTYYQVTWPVAGYQPGEVATISLLGRELRLRPSASYTYAFGDGESLGPTLDPGGTYPSGKVRHTYLDTGTAPVTIRAAYTGQYSLDGGPWRDVDLTVPVPGQPVDVQIKQAISRLVTGPSGATSSAR